MGKWRTCAQEAIDFMRGHNFGWKALWDSNPELSCLKLTLELIAVQFSRLTWEECGPCHVFACYTLAFVLQQRKKHGINLSQGTRQYSRGRIKREHDTLLRAARRSCRSLSSCFRGPGSIMDQRRYLRSCVNKGFPTSANI